MRRDVFYIKQILVLFVVFVCTKTEAQTLPNLRYHKLMKNISYKSSINDTLIFGAVENNNQETSTHSILLHFETQIVKEKKEIVANHKLKKYALFQYTLLSYGQKEMKDFSSKLSGATLSYHYDRKGNYLFTEDTLTDYLDAKIEHESFLKATQRILPFGPNSNVNWANNLYQDTITQNISIINGLNIEFRNVIFYKLIVDSADKENIIIEYKSDSIHISAIDGRLSAQGFGLNISGMGKISGLLIYDKITMVLKDALETAQFDCNYEMKTPSRNIEIPLSYKYTIKTEQQIMGN